MGKVRVKITESQMNYLFENSKIEHIKNEFGVIGDSEFEALSVTEKSRRKGLPTTIDSDVEGVETPKEKNYILTPIKNHEGMLIALILTDEKNKSKVRISETTFDKIVNADPTNNKFYVRWLLKILIEFIKDKDFEESIRFVDEDLNVAKESLTIFHNMKDRKIFKETASTIEGLPNNPSLINEYTSIGQLFKSIEPFMEGKGEMEEEIKNFIASGEAKILYEDSRWIVYVPLSLPAACIIGNITSICTSKEGNSHYKSISTKNPRPDGKPSKFYIIINKNVLKGLSKEVYQFHFETNQFRNRTQSGPSGGPGAANMDWVDFLEKNPGLFNFFKNTLMDLAEQVRDKGETIDRNEYFKLLMEMGSVDNILDYFSIDREVLNLKGYKIRKLPSGIDRFENLLFLNISNTGIDSLPDEIVNLKKLELIHMANNNIKELPKNFGDLSSLEVFTIQGNPLKGLPESIKKLDGQIFKMTLPVTMSDEAKNKAIKLLPKTKITWS